MADTVPQARPAPPGVNATSSANSSSSNMLELIRNRESQELVIAICGAIGSGTKDLSERIKAALADENYAVETIKVSNLILELKKDTGLLKLSAYDKYTRYQDAGNDIRQKLGNNKLAAEAIADIISKREKYLEKPPGKDGAEVKADDFKTTKKVCYIIDQLKHPDEVILLRAVYRQNFYLIGVTSTEKQRVNNLINQSITHAQADELIHRDRKDDCAYGQHVEKTFYLSDYFIRNNDNAAHLKKSVDRLIKLIHGYNGITPTNDEVGMFTAYSASLKSACLSRQVGAAIMNSEGDILSTGCNDVPASGGGLYTAEFADNDHRCIFSGEKCFNDHHKGKLQLQFHDILDKELTTTFSPGSELSKALDEDSISESTKEKISSILRGKINSISERLLKESRAKDLIEYSRAIHAEMDALIQLARTEGQTTIQTTLYTTTYPCHNCARHIVAAGISKVIYIEPYEKSLALELHSDSISDTGEPNKVYFEPFEGVSPQRYTKFFLAFDRKDKKTGKAIITRPAESHHIDPQYLDSYVEYEMRVAKITKEQKNPFKSD